MSRETEQDSRTEDKNYLIDLNYGKYLGEVILKEWEKLNRHQTVEADKKDFGEALGLIMVNEYQKIQMNELNEKLMKAAERYDQDLKMAQTVQKSLIGQDAPKTENYDLACYYQPYSLVSGDFYDIYINEKGELEGLVLADVSGHGIASSLLTVLAKPIFYRNFKRYKDDSLGELLKKVNDKLVTAMGVVENYLTSIMLRFFDDKVEYVNAAHPDILVKSFDERGARRINSDDYNSRGSLLGISSTMSDFKSHIFPVKKGDIIVTFTDCLLEEKNKEGIEYGEENIIKVLEKSKPEESASEVMDRLVKDFKNFIGKEAYNDDLSIVVIKKK